MILQHDIDFVIPWVDGSDPAWQSAFNNISQTPDMDARISRYRDWDLLRYWFRGVDRYAPWVNRIHFITWGHIPSWLNTEHPKLNIVKHSDYIPASYLPTFSSHTIELNLHHLSTLSEQFVYFNDDMFLLRPVSKHYFFKNGLPCDSALLNPLYTMDLADDQGDQRIFYIPMNDVQHLNRFYQARQAMLTHPLKWFNLKYGSYLLRNLFLAAWPRFTGFVDLHIPQPYLKTSFIKAWRDYADILDATCRNAIRTDHDVNQWLIRYQQLAEGNFCPRKPISNASFMIGRDNESLLYVVRKQRCSMICLNDSLMEQVQFEKCKAALIDAFDQNLPQRSSFEK